MASRYGLAVTAPPHAPVLAPEGGDAVDVVLRDDDVIEHRTLTGDISAAGAAGAANVEVIGSLFRTARLTGIALRGITLRDCRFENCELSGALLDAARLVRVEFIDCRLAGTVLSDARIDDVRFVDCRCEGLLFRMSTLKRSAFLRCDLTNAEFYESRLGNVSLADSDLSSVDFSRAQLDQVRLHGSVISDLRGGASLRGAIIDPEQIVPMGLVALDALGVVIEDGDE